ncbi:MAG: redoxin domain-containing protein [Anaerolineales bacterium]
MDTLKPGDSAPDFELNSDRGEPVKLSDYRGQTVVLYFYPRADTPGCTKEACAFRDDYRITQPGNPGSARSAQGMMLALYGRDSQV